MTMLNSCTQSTRQYKLDCSDLGFALGTAPLIYSTHCLGLIGRSCRQVDIRPKVTETYYKTLSAQRAVLTVVFRPLAQVTPHSAFAILC